MPRYGRRRAADRGGARGRRRGWRPSSRFAATDPTILGASPGTSSRGHGGVGIRAPAGPAHLPARDWRSGRPGRPTAQQLAYVAEVDGYRQLFVRPLVGRRRAAAHPTSRGTTSSPPGHPTARRLAFVRGATATGKLEPYEVDGYYFEGAELWTLELGSGARPPSCSTTGSIPRTRPTASGSPSTRCSRARSGSGSRIPGAATRARSPRIPARRWCTRQPRWSPDGSKLAFRRIEKLKSDIAIVDIATQAVTRVTDDYVVDAVPDLDARRPRRSCFSSSRGGGSISGGCRLGPDGAATGPAEQLTTGAGDDVQAAVHPGWARARRSRCEASTPTFGSCPSRPRPAGRAGTRRRCLARPGSRAVAPGRPTAGCMAFNSDRAGEMNIWVPRLRPARAPGDVRSRRRLPARLVTRRDRAGVLLRAGRQYRHLAGAARRYARSPGLPRTRRSTSIRPTRRTDSGSRSSPTGAAIRGLAHAGRRNGAEAGGLGGLLGAFRGLDRGQPRDRLPRRARPADADLPRGRRERRADAAATGARAAATCRSRPRSR